MFRRGTASRCSASVLDAVSGLRLDVSAVYFAVFFRCYVVTTNLRTRCVLFSRCSCHRSSCNMECLKWLLLQLELSATGMFPVSGVHLEVHCYCTNCRSCYFLTWWQDRRSAYSGIFRSVRVTIIGVNKQ